MYVEKCVKCKGKNKTYIAKVEGMYYARCECGKWDKFQFLGLRPEYAVEEWNRANRPIKRGKNESGDSEY